MDRMAERIIEAYEVVADLPQPYGAIAFEWLLGQLGDSVPKSSTQLAEADQVTSAQEAADGSPSASSQSPSINWEQLSRRSGIPASDLEAVYAIHNGKLQIGQTIPNDLSTFREKTHWVACLLVFAYTYGLGVDWVPGARIREELDRLPNALDKNNWSSKHMEEGQLFTKKKTGGTSATPDFRINSPGEKKAILFLKEIFGNDEG